MLAMMPSITCHKMAFAASAFAFAFVKQAKKKKGKVRSKDAERGAACIWAACADCTNRCGLYRQHRVYACVMSKAALLSPFFS